MTVGEKIQEILDWSGKTQADLAALADIPRSSISDYVRGARVPSLEAVQKIAAALDVSSWAVINGEPLAVEAIDLTEAERVFLGEYRKLTGMERESVNGVIRAFNLRK